MRAFVGLRRRLTSAWPFPLLIGLMLGAGVVSLLGVISGDNGGQEEDAVGGSAIITRSEIGSYPKSSVQRAFLRYWSSLQFGAWPEAISAFEPGLADFIGRDRLTEALMLQGGYVATVKPSLVEVKRVGDTMSIRYFLEDPTGKDRPQSNFWVERDGSWKIIRDSYLDEVLRAHAESEIDPATKNPSARAAQAEKRAVELQDEYLNQLPDGSSPFE